MGMSVVVVVARAGFSVSVIVGTCLLRVLVAVVVRSLFFFRVILGALFTVSVGMSAVRVLVVGMPAMVVASLFLIRVILGAPFSMSVRMFAVGMLGVGMSAVVVGSFFVFRVILSTSFPMSMGMPVGMSVVLGATGIVTFFFTHLFFGGNRLLKRAHRLGFWHSLTHRLEQTRRLWKYM